MVRRLLSAAATAAALAITGVACDENKQSTPEATVRQYFDALSTSDDDALLATLCPINRGDWGGFQFALSYFGLETPPIGYRNLTMIRTYEDGDRVDLNVGFSFRLLFLETPPTELPFRTVREGNRWYICDDSPGIVLQ